MRCVDGADPGLEDMREFFETVDDAAAAEKELDRQNERNKLAAAANAAAAVQQSQPTAKRLDAADIEWEGEWS